MYKGKGVPFQIMGRGGGVLGAPGQLLVALYSEYWVSKPQ